MDPYLPPQAPPPPPAAGSGPPPPSPQPPQPVAQHPTAWTTNFQNHQPPQPAAPVVAAAPTFAPSERTKGGSVAKNVILGLLTVFILLPILAIFALTMLGRTVEEEFVQIPMETGADVSQVEAVDAPVLAFEDVATPTSGQLYVESSGRFSISVDPSWQEPVVQPNLITGLESTSWVLEEYSSPDFLANVNVSHSFQPDGISLDAVVEAEIAATEAQVPIESVQQRDRVVNGMTFREVSFDLALDGIELTAVSWTRLDGNVVHMVTLAAPTETAAEAWLAVEPYALTLDVAGATD